MATIEKKHGQTTGASKYGHSIDTSRIVVIQFIAIEYTDSSKLPSSYASFVLAQHNTVCLVLGIVYTLIPPSYPLALRWLRIRATMRL
jgi:hypothetical protein